MGRSNSGDGATLPTSGRIWTQSRLSKFRRSISRNLSSILRRSHKWIIMISSRARSATVQAPGKARYSGHSRQCRPSPCVAGWCGKPPLSAEIAVGIKTPGAKIGDYQPVCCLVVTNTGRRQFDHCLVQMTELSRVPRNGCPCHLTLRTDCANSEQRTRLFSNICRAAGYYSTRLSFAPTCERMVSVRREWSKLFHPSRSDQNAVRIYGGAAPGAAEVFINTDAGWNAMPSVRTVPTDFVLNQVASAGQDRSASLRFFRSGAGAHLSTTNSCSGSCNGKFHLRFDQTGAAR